MVREKPHDYHAEFTTRVGADVQEVREALQRIEDMEERAITEIRADLRTFSEAIGKLAVNIERQTQMLDSHKEITMQSFEVLRRDVGNVADNVRTNRADIDTILKDISRIQGAMWLARIVWVAGAAVLAAGAWLVDYFGTHHQ